VTRDGEITLVTRESDETIAGPAYRAAHRTLEPDTSVLMRPGDHRDCDCDWHGSLPFPAIALSRLA
jgi:hypothetical protein